MSTPIFVRNSIMLTVESFQAVNVAGPNMLAWLVPWLSPDGGPQSRHEVSRNGKNLIVSTFELIYNCPDGMHLQHSHEQLFLVGCTHVR